MEHRVSSKGAKDISILSPTWERTEVRGGSVAIIALTRI